MKIYFTRMLKFYVDLFELRWLIVKSIHLFRKVPYHIPKNRNGTERFWRTIRLLLLVLPTILTQPVYAQQSTIYLPMVAGPLADSAPIGCNNLNEDEVQMETELLTASGQQRPILNCSPTLSAVARARAEDMATRNYFRHINPDGVGPDFLVEQAGYNLPDYYPVTLTSNHVESMAAGSSYPTASVAWAALMESDSHRKHLLGTEQFFQEQSEYGVGYAYSGSTRHRNYWVFITAHPVENE